MKKEKEKLKEQGSDKFLRYFSVIFIIFKSEAKRDSIFRSAATRHRDLRGTKMRMNNQIWLQRPKAKKEKWSGGVGEIINGNATFCITSG